MTRIEHNALLRRTRSMDVWWSAPVCNMAATLTNWFSDRLKKIKPAIKTRRKVLNGPYVHNKLSYVFFSRFSSGHPSYLDWQVTGHANVTVMTAGLCPSCYFVKEKFSNMCPNHQEKYFPRFLLHLVHSCSTLNQFDKTSQHCWDYQVSHSGGQASGK